MSPVYKLSANSVKNGRTIYGSMLAGNPTYTIPTSFESIATVTVSSNVSSIEFTSIPQDYTHLQIRYIARTNRTTYVDDVIGIQFNSDTSALYNHHTLDGTGTAVESGASASNQTLPRIARCSGSGAGSNTFGAGIIDILDYKNTNKNHVARCLNGNEVNASGSTISMFSVLHRSTTAITSIKLQVVVTESQFNFVANSHFALYGIKGAA